MYDKIIGSSDRDLVSDVLTFQRIFHSTTYPQEARWWKGWEEHQWNKERSEWKGGKRKGGS